MLKLNFTQALLCNRIFILLLSVLNIALLVGCRIFLLCNLWNGLIASILCCELRSLIYRNFPIHTRFWIGDLRSILLWRGRFRKRSFFLPAINWSSHHVARLRVLILVRLLMFNERRVRRSQLVCITHRFIIRNRPLIISVALLLIHFALCRLIVESFRGI